LNYLPVISSLSSGTITDVGATVAGTIDNGKLETVWSVEYGLTNAYGSTATGGTITEPTAVTKALTGLAQNTLYYWRLKAVNSKGTTYSAEQTLTTTNVRWILPVAGRTSGTATAGTMVISTTEDITPTVTGDVTISVAQAADGSYRKHTLTVNCPNNGSGTIIIPDRSKVVTLSDHAGAMLPQTIFYAGTAATAPIVTLDLNKIPATVLRIHQNAVGSILVVTGNTALPANMNYLKFDGDNISYTYTGSLPSGLTYLFLRGTGIAITSNSPLPSGITNFYITGNLIDLTFNTVTGTANITTLNLLNHRISKMSSADMVTLLDSLRTKTGTLPTIITINDYADYASPPQTVVDAVAALKTAKSITTVNLGA